MSLVCCPRHKCSEEEGLNLQTPLQDVHRHFVKLELTLFWQQFQLPFYLLSREDIAIDVDLCDWCHFGINVVEDL